MFGGDLGTAFLGSQGDVWDAQKDMALASLGGFITMAVTAAINATYQRDFAREWADSFRVRGHEPLGEVALAQLRGKTPAP
jgi:putative membrane protein